MEARHLPLETDVIQRGFHWIRFAAAEQAERFAVLFLTMGWTWDGAAAPPSPADVRTTILQMVDQLDADLRESTGGTYPYAVIAAAAGGIEVGVERQGQLGTPKAFIRLVIGDMVDLTNAPPSPPDSSGSTRDHS